MHGAMHTVIEKREKFDSTALIDNFFTLTAADEFNNKNRYLENL